VGAGHPVRAEILLVSALHGSTLPLQSESALVPGVPGSRHYSSASTGTKIPCSS
jgi:hypothetical protein